MMHSLAAYTWNAAGHKLVAQIAYDHLSPAAQQMCLDYLNIKDPKVLESSIIVASTWLDLIRKNKAYHFNQFHYVDLPFSKDKSKLPKIKQRNALWAINKALLVLSSNKESQSSKALNLKILLHLVGDIHQPLHAATKISRRFPRGDLGGNLYLLSKSPFGKNLHQYWDNGAGTLIAKQSKDIQTKAHVLEKKWPCSVANQDKKPEQWLFDAHYIAVHQAYSIKGHRNPSKNYQKRTKEIVEQQISFAGCRLATLLNALGRINYPRFDINHAVSVV
jgi:hypothetical protein